MFERFTDRARGVVVQAQVEARELRHNFIGTEHLLLGLIHEDEGLAIRVLRALNVDPRALADQVKELVGQGDKTVIVGEHIPFTPRSKKALELALRESQRLQHDYIGTEHILLSLLAQAEGPAYQALVLSGVDLDTARAHVDAQVKKLLRERERTVTTRPVQLRVEGPMPESEATYQLRSINRRLAAIEAKLGIEPSAAERRLRQFDAEILKARKEKIAAIDASDFPAAARHREQERRLISQRAEAQRAWLEELEEEPPLL